MSKYWMGIRKERFPWALAGLGILAGAFTAGDPDSWHLFCGYTLGLLVSALADIRARSNK